METKICVVCGAEFESKTKRQTCSEVCRHKLTQSKIDHKESAKKAKLTNLERYGADNIMKLPEGKEKFKASMMRIHGVEFARQIPELREASVKMFQSAEHKAKSKAGFKKKYGVESPFAVKEIRDKAKATIKEKYDCDNPMKNPEVVAKSIETKKSVYGDDFMQTFAEKGKETSRAKFGCDNWAYQHIKNFDKLKDVEFVLSNFVKDNRFLIREMMQFFNIQEAYVNRWKRDNGVKIPNKIKKSHTQQKIFDSLDVDDKIMNTKSLIAPLEIDIYLPKAKLAIEYNGLMYHSRGVHKSSKMNTSDFPIDYHLMKTNKCNEKGVQLLHIFEGESLDLWLSLIKSKLGLNAKLQASKCSVVELTVEEASIFCDNNCIDGYIESSVFLGLVSSNELASVMLFNEIDTNNFELTRFCNKCNLDVIDAEITLFEHFKQNHTGTVSYSFNKRFGNPVLPNILGFSKVQETAPRGFYFKNYSFDIISEDVFRATNTESDDELFKNNYRKIYDCGSIIFDLDLSKL